MLLLGSNVDERKVAFIALQAIYGVGPALALSLCNLVGISPNTRLNELSINQHDLLAKSCRRLVTSNKKHRKIIESIKNLVRISCYRGTRHINALPCRGQRTRTNAFTSKKLLIKERSLLK